MPRVATRPQAPVGRLVLALALAGPGVGAGCGTAAASPSGRAEGPAGAAAVHPQDGPHADLQVRVDDDGVHLLLQLNLAFADELVEPLREDLAVLHPVEAEDLREELLLWCAEHCRVAVDDTPLEGRAASWEVVPPALERLAYYPRFGARALTTLRLGLEYPSPAPPDVVRLEWDAYPPNLALGDAREDAPPLEVLARFAGYGEHELLTLRADAPRVTWRVPPPEERGRLFFVPDPAASGAGDPLRRLRVPAAATGALLLLAALLRLVRGGERGRATLLLAAGTLLVAAGVLRAGRAGDLPDEAHVREAAEGLLRNVYRAFDHTLEEDVYDTLARSVEGPLLDELYTAVHAGLVMQEEEGALSQVDALRVDEVVVEEVAEGTPPGGPRAEVVIAWQVDGSVYHGGHGHFRTTAYRARYRLHATDAGWRIQDHEPLEQVRLSSRTDDPTRPEADAPAGDPTDDPATGPGGSPPPEEF